MADQDKSLDELLDMLHKDGEPEAPLPGTTPNEMIKAQARARAPEIEVVEECEDDGPNILKKILKDFETVGAEILGKWREDRDQIQNVIDLLLPIVRGNNDVARVHWEVLGQLLDTKASTSLTAVKLLDAKTRLLATTKIQILNQNGEQSASSELDRVLAQPVDDDFNGDNNDKRQRSGADRRQ